VRLEVFDMLSRKVATLVSATVPAGTHAYTLRTDVLSPLSGVDFYCLQAGEFVETRKMMLVK